MFWVCVCTLTYPACNPHAPYRHLWPTPLCNIVPQYLINSKSLPIMLLEGKMYVLILSTALVWYICHSRNNWARYDQKCISVFTWSTVNYREVPWITVKYREVPWITVKYRELPWSTVKHREVPWIAVKYREVPVFLLYFNETSIPLHVFQNHSNIKFITIRPKAAQLFHADERADSQRDRHEEADSRFPPISRTRAINYTTGTLAGTVTMTDRDKMDPRKTRIKVLFGEFCIRPER